MPFLLLILVTALSGESTDLWSLLQTKRFDRAEALLSEGAYVDAKRSGSSALHRAVNAGNLKAVKFLLEHGADVEDSDQEEETPLMLASAKGDLPMVRYLVGREASLEAVSRSFRTPLMYAVQNHRDSVVAFLLERKADPFFEPFQKGGYLTTTNALFLAVESRDSALFEKLFALRPDPNHRLGGGGTLLMAAARANLPWLVQRLLSMGADLSSVDRRGNTALHLACRAGADTSILGSLIRDGASPDARNLGGETPLHLAVESKNTALVELLLRGKVEVDLPDASGRTAFARAMGAGLEEIGLLLHGKGANPVVHSEYRNEPTLLVSNRCPRLALLVLQSGADPNGKVHPNNFHGERRYERILTMAATQGWNEVLQLALARGADPSLTNGEGLDALQCALENHQYGAFQFLVKSGVRIEKRLAGEYLGWLVVSDDSLGAIPSLLGIGARVDDRDRSGRTPLMIAAAHGQARNLKVLLEAKADPTLRDEKGRLALHAAVDTGCLECVQVLVEEGAALKEAFPPERSLVSMALVRGDTALAQWLLAHGAPAPLSDLAYAKVFGEGASSEVAGFVVRKVPKVRLGTALLKAVASRNPDLVRFLIEAGADVNARDSEGRTPMMIHCDLWGPQEIRDLLAENGARGDLRDKSGVSVEDHCAGLDGE